MVSIRFSMFACLILLLLRSWMGLCQVVVGTLPNEQHGISGTLELLSTTQIRVTGFSYDGGGPDAFLYYFRPGVSVAHGQGTIIRFPQGKPEDGAFLRGRRFTNEVITFSMPAGSDVCDIGTFTIWCRLARAFFTRLAFPRSLFARNGADPCALMGAATSPPLIMTTLPPPTSVATSATTGMPAPAATGTAPQASTLEATTRAPPEDTTTPAPTTLTTTPVVAGTLPSGAHDVRGTLTYLSTTRIRIVGFSYDGTAPATFLYYYPPGATANPSGGGVKIPLATDNGGTSSGAFQSGVRYSNQDLTVDMPSGTDVCDIGIFTVWCEAASVIFSQLTVSRSLFENNGADPCTLKITTTTVAPSPGDFENCEMFHSSLQLRWTVDRPQRKIRFMLSGCQSDSVTVLRYMGFGLSGSNTRTSMDDADVTITWIDGNAQANAVDYFLRSRTQCRSGMGVCPDEQDSRGTCSNNVEDVSGMVLNREQRVSFTRNFTTSDTDCDLPFNVDSDQYIVWAIGGVEQTAFRHDTRSGGSTAPIRFGRSATNNCGTTAITCTTCDPFQATMMDARGGNTVFRATIGPSGNARGYTALTNQVGWGIAWYINDSLIPELIVERGRTYTFVVEGGTDPNDGANYHPFYITSSPTGGILLNTAQEKSAERVHAGISSTGQPTAVGRLCVSTETAESFNILDRCGSFNNFKASLRKTCGSGEPGVLQWTPDRFTPDLVYYQCATHRNLGWRITVTDSSSSTTQDSDLSVTTSQQTATAGAPSTIMAASMLVIMLRSLLTCIIIH